MKTEIYIYGAGHKAKRLVLECINGVSSNPVEGRTKIWQHTNLILTLCGFIFRRIYIEAQTIQWQKKDERTKNGWFTYTNPTNKHQGVLRSFASISSSCSFSDTHCVTHVKNQDRETHQWPWWYHNYHRFNIMGTFWNLDFQ